MGELVGLPEWLAATLFVVVILIAVMTFGYLNIRRAHQHLAERRPSPTLQEFLEMMGEDVDEDLARWMWDRCEYYYRPLAPHPDDHLTRDARIDDDDVDMDWVPAFLSDFGMDPALWPKEWPEWPAEWDLTVRNFGRFLQLGRNRLAETYPNRASASPM